MLNRCATLALAVACLIVLTWSVRTQSLQARKLAGCLETLNRCQRCSDGERVLFLIMHEIREEGPTPERLARLDVAVAGALALCEPVEVADAER